MAMRVKIDTKEKVIYLLEPVTIEELNSFVYGMGFKDYKISFEKHGPVYISSPNMNHLSPFEATTDPSQLGLFNS